MSSLIPGVMMKQVRYILVDAAGSPATYYDQADNEHEITGPSLFRLLDLVEMTEDTDSETVLKALGFDGTLTLPSGQYKIKREEFEVLDLQTGDIIEMERLREEAGVEMNDTRR